MGATDLVAAATFVLVAAIVIGPYYLLVVRPERAQRQMLRRRILTGGAPGSPGAAGGGLLKDVEPVSTIGPLNRALSGDNPIARAVRHTVEMSGVKVTPGQLVLGSASLTLLAYLLFLWWIPQAPVIAVVLAPLIGLGPYTVLRILRARRLNRFEEQFPEAVDLIARTLRAGHAFATGLKMAADDLPDPISSEFRLLHDQQNYGMPLNDSLRAFADRVPLIDARFFVTAVLTQREAGGNLAEVLDNLSEVIRERFKIKRQLRVISAHGRLTGAILGILPPALGLFMAFRLPGHFTTMLQDPLGIRMIVVAVFLQLLGAFLIYRITKVEY